MPPDLGLYIYASRVDGARGDIRPFQVNARNHFLIQYLAPGEYELRLEIRDYSVKPKIVDPQLSRAISQARQKVVVSRNNQQPAIMTFDLSREGPNDEDQRPILSQDHIVWRHAQHFF